MGHLEGNFTPVLYMGRKVPKGWYERPSFTPTLYNRRNISRNIGCAIAEVVSRSNFTTETLVRSQNNSGGIYGVPSVNRTSFFPQSTSVFPCQYHYTNVPYPFIRLSPMICLILGSCSVIKWTQAVGTVGIPAEMRTRHTQNTSEQHYPLTL